MLKVTYTQNKLTRDPIAIQMSELDTPVDNKNDTLDITLLATCTTSEEAKKRCSYWQMYLFGNQNLEDN